jgi:hypothetical protein
MMRATLAECFRSPALFGTAFAGESWKPWHAVAKIISGEQLHDDELALALKCTGRTRLPDKPPRRLYMLVGRRGAKSRFAAAAAVHAAVAMDWRRIMAPGEQAVILLLAVDRAQAAICRRYASGLIEASAVLKHEVVRETSDVIELRNGAVIQIGTNDHRSVRGRSIAVLVGDEACFWMSDGESSSSDAEVVAAVEPAMAMIPCGGLVIMISSVYRKRGLMYERWKALHGNDAAGDLCWLADSATMNPLLPPEIVAKALAEDPGRARAEYLSQWREDLTDFIPADVIEAATDWGVRERSRIAGVRYCAFTDAAGGSGSDGFTLGISHIQPDGVVVLDVLRERVPRFVPAAVVAEYSALLKSYGVFEVRGDHFSGAWCSDEFVRNGIRYLPSQKTKSEIYLAALPLLLSGRARLLDDEKLRRQLGGLERRVHAGGRESVDHGAGAGSHDDCANSACGALVNATRKGAIIQGPMVIVGGVARFDGIGAPSGPWERLMIEERRTAERERVEADGLRQMWGG